MFDIIGGSKFITKIALKTKLDLIRGIPEHIEKKGFQNKYGQHEYLVFPVGLCNVLSTPIFMMNVVLNALVDRFGAVYLEDILIFSETAEENRRHV